MYDEIILFPLLLFYSSSELLTLETTLIILVFEWLVRSCKGLKLLSVLLIATVFFLLQWWEGQLLQYDAVCCCWASDCCSSQFKTC